MKISSNKNVIKPSSSYQLAIHLEEGTLTVCLILGKITFVNDQLP
jgi:hypothetical protein